MFHRFAHIKQYRLRPMIYSIKDIARLRWWQCNKKLPLDKFLAVVDCVSAKDIEKKINRKNFQIRRFFQINTQGVSTNDLPAPISPRNCIQVIYRLTCLRSGRSWASFTLPTSLTHPVVRVGQWHISRVVTSNTSEGVWISSVQHFSDKPFLLPIKKSWPFCTT